MSLPRPIREALRFSRDRLFLLLHRRAVNHDWRLHHYACDCYRQNFQRHPDSALPCGPAARIPDFDRLHELTDAGVLVFVFTHATCPCPPLQFITFSTASP